MQNILDKQREFFKSGATLSVKVRLEYLKKLKDVIKANEQAIFEAIYKVQLKLICVKLVCH